MIRRLIQYILVAALRDKLLVSFFVTLVVGVALSSFFASTAVTEKNQFFIVFVATMLRLASVFTIVTFVVFYVRKTFETREVEFMLTRPISRVSYLTAHCLAFFTICFVFTIISSFVIGFISADLFSYNLLMWALSLLVEISIMAHIALFFSFTLNSAVTASLASFAFYALSRMVGGILGIIQSDPAEGVMNFLEKTMLFISMIVPRLDLLSRSEWIIYGVSDFMNLIFVFVQFIIFIGLIYFATLIDLKRREF